MMMMMGQLVEAIEATGLVLLRNNVIVGCVSTHLPERDSATSLSWW